MLRRAGRPSIHERATTIHADFTVGCQAFLTESATHTPEGAMSAQNEKTVVRIDLTPEQQDRIKTATGKSIEALQMSAEDLEQRIAPGLALNHNETFLIA
jgi:hypothetical protein